MNFRNFAPEVHFVVAWHVMFLPPISTINFIRNLLIYPSIIN